MTFNKQLIRSVILLGFFGFGRISAQQADFWPFKVGNVWEYQHIRGTGYEYLADGEVRFVVTTRQVVLRIDATEMIDGKTYFRFNNGQLLRKDTAGNIYEYLRFADTKGEAYLTLDFFTPNSHDTAHITPIPYLPFPPEGHATLLGNQPAMWPQQRHWIESSNRPLEVPFGTFTEYFSFDYSLGLADVYVYSFVDGVGLVLSSKGSDTPGLNRYELVRATINDKDFPTNVESSSGWGAIKLRER